MIRVLRIANFALLAFLVGCSSLAPLLTTPTPAPVSEATSIPQTTPTSAPPTLTTTDQNQLTLWLPPQFDPHAETASAQLFNQRLQGFQDEHPGLQMEVRIKSNTDITGALATTNKAAPSNMPDLIALSYSDMQSAASAGYLHPLDGLTSALQDPDWYSFARELGHVQNTEYGLPFASDALVILHRPSAVIEPSLSWDAIISSGNQMAVPISDPQALLALSLYMSAGGGFSNAEGQLGLDEEILTQVFALYQRALEAGALPLEIREFKTDMDALGYFRNGNADFAVIHASSDFQTFSGEYLPLLGLNDAHYSLGDGWVWALAGSNSENQSLAAELANYLVESEYLSEWTLAYGVLPTRPQAVDAWSDELLKTSINDVLQSAHPLPSKDVMTVVSPLLLEGLNRIFNGEQPEVVARSVIENLK